MTDVNSCTIISTSLVTPFHTFSFCSSLFHSSIKIPTLFSFFLFLFLLRLLQLPVPSCFYLDLFGFSHGLFVRYASLVRPLFSLIPAVVSMYKFRRRLTPFPFLDFRTISTSHRTNLTSFCPSMSTHFRFRSSSHRATTRSVQHIHSDSDIWYGNTTDWISC